MEEDKTVSFHSKTIYEEKEPITQKQLSQYWHLFPYSLRKAINKAKRGDFKNSVSDQELKEKIDQYLTNSKNGSSGNNNNDECPK